MQIFLYRPLTWLTAFVIVFSLYAHTFLNVDSAVVTPLSAAAIAGGLSALSALWFLRLRFATVSTGSGIVAAFCLLTALGLAMISGVTGVADRGLNLNDLGLLLVIVGVPVLVYCNSDRAELLTALGWWCAAFALMDALANGGAVIGLWHLQDAGARYTDAGRLERFGGLTGNSHASGIVAMIGVAYLARDGLRRRPAWAWAAMLGAILIIGLSLVVIDARRYLGGAALVAGLLMLPGARLVPLQFASAALGASGMAFTWLTRDPEEFQRTALMAAGWRDAAANILVGEGVRYKSLSGIGFNALWSSGVTESGVLDLAIQFGWIATVLFIVGVLIALRGTRRVLPWPAVLLAVMFGQLPYINLLGGFLGTVAFYAALVWIICDELPAARRAAGMPVPAQA